MKKLIICAGGDALMVTPLPPHYTGREIIRPYLRSADFSAVNLEAVLSDYTCFPGAASGGTWVNATPDIFPQLHSFGFDLYGCANNHALDYSYGGLASTCRILEQANVPFCGIGESLEKADAPAICEKNGKKLGVMAVTTTFHDDWRAGRECEDLPSRPGVSFLRHTTIFTVTQTQFDVLDTIAKNATINGSRPLNVAAGFESPDPPGMLTFGKELFLVGEEEKRETFCHPGDLNRILDGVKKASKQLDGLIVLAHSHEVKREAYHEPADFFVEFCHAVLDAGALAVIGGGTHQLKPIEMYHGKPIFYSLGDFIFQNSSVRILPPDFKEKYGLSPRATTQEAYAARSRNGTIGLHTDPLHYRSVLPRLTFENNHLVKAELLPIELGFDQEDDIKGLPFAAKGETVQSILEQLKTLSAPFGTRFDLKPNGIMEIIL